jgi:hypothetical protein
VDSAPLGSENGPHQSTYKAALDPEQDTVIAHEQCNARAGQAVSSSPAPVRREPAETGRVLKLHPDELVRLAPRLRLYLRRPDPTWPEVVDAADWLRHDLDVSKPLWGEACLAMGREQAAIALGRGVDQGPGAFPDHGRWLFPRHGGEGEGRGAEPGPHAVGLAAGQRAKTAQPAGNERRGPSYGCQRGTVVSDRLVFTPRLKAVA